MAKDLIELDETQLRHLIPSPQTLRYLKFNQLSRKSLNDLQFMINDAIIKGVRPNYYIEETEKAINLQLHNLNISNIEE